jgi:hypothetical protein
MPSQRRREGFFALAVFSCGLIFGGLPIENAGGRIPAGTYVRPRTYPGMANLVEPQGRRIIEEID